MNTVNVHLIFSVNLTNLQRTSLSSKNITGITGTLSTQVLLVICMLIIPSQTYWQIVCETFGKGV